MNTKTTPITQTMKIASQWLSCHTIAPKACSSLLLTCLATVGFAEGSPLYIASGEGVASIYDIKSGQVKATAPMNTEGMTNLHDGRVLTVSEVGAPGEGKYALTLYASDRHNALKKQASIALPSACQSNGSVNKVNNIALLSCNGLTAVIDISPNQLRHIRSVKGNDAKWLSKDYFYAKENQGSILTYNYTSSTPLNTFSALATDDVIQILPNDTANSDTDKAVEMYALTYKNRVAKRRTAANSSVDADLRIIKLTLTKNGLVKTSEHTLVDTPTFYHRNFVTEAVKAHNDPAEIKKAIHAKMPLVFENYSDNIAIPMVNIYNKSLSGSAGYSFDYDMNRVGDYVTFYRNNARNLVDKVTYFYSIKTGRFEQRLNLGGRIMHAHKLKDGRWHILSFLGFSDGGLAYRSSLYSANMSEEISNKRIALAISTGESVRYPYYGRTGELSAVHFDTENNTLYFRTRMNEPTQAAINLNNQSVSNEAIQTPPFTANNALSERYFYKVDLWEIPALNFNSQDAEISANNDVISRGADASQPLVADVLNNDVGTGIKIVEASPSTLIKDNKLIIGERKTTAYVYPSAVRYTIEDQFGNQSSAYVQVEQIDANKGSTNTLPKAIDYKLSNTGQIQTIHLANDTKADSLAANERCEAKLLTGAKFGLLNGEKVYFSESMLPTLTYQAFDNIKGKETLWYQMSCYRDLAQDALHTIASIDIDINTVQAPAPTAITDRTAVTLGNSVKIEVLNNDTGEAINLVSVDTSSTAGSVKIEGNHIVYTADNGNAGMDIFTYTIKDKFGRTSSAKVAVNVTTTPTVSLLYAAEDKVTVFSGQSIVINALSNDSGNGKRIIGVKAAEHGTVSDSWKTKQVIEYTAASAGTDADEFWYGITDASNQAQSWTKVSITVKHKPNSGAPVAHPDSATTESEAVTINVTANDEGLPVTVVYVDEAQHGEVTIEDYAVRYTPHAGFKGMDSFWYAISNASGKVSWGEVTVSVGSDSITPIVLREDKAFTTAGVAVMIDPLTNDDGDQLRITSVDEADDGTDKIVNNQLHYTPNSKFTGTESLWIEVTDGFDNSKWSEVIIQVAENPDILSAKPDHKQLQMGESISVDVLANDTGIDLTLEDESGSWLGETRIVDGQLVFTAHNGMSGQDRIWYGISDQTGEWVWSYLDVTVIGDAAEVKTTANVDEITLKAGQSKTVAVLNNDTGEDLRLEEANESWLGEIERYGDTVTFTAGNEAGTDKIWYGISDASAEWAWSHILVTVTK